MTLLLSPSYREAAEAYGEGNPGHLTEDSLDTPGARKWRLGVLGQAGCNLGQTVRSQAQKGETTKGLTELTVLWKREGIEIILQAEWSKAADVFEPCSVKPGENLGGRVGEVVVHHHPRRFGQAKYGLSRVWKVFLDLFTVKMLVTFAPRPAAWFGLLSMPFWLGACVGAGAIVFLVGMGQGPSLVVVGSISLLFACTAIHLISMGLLAEAALDAEGGVQGGDSLPDVLEL